MDGNMIKHQGPFKRLAFCECGWSTEPAFGDVWFAEQRHPCCPACGSGAKYQMKTVSYVERKTGTKKFLGIFSVADVERLYVTADGAELPREPKATSTGMTHEMRRSAGIRGLYRGFLKELDAGGKLNLPPGVNVDQLVEQTNFETLKGASR